MIIPTRQVADCADLDPCRLGLSLPAWRDCRAPSEESLVGFARSLRLDPEAWTLLAPFVGFDARQYRRVRAWRDAQWEALLLCWLPGQATNVHDHGGSVGVSAVLCGTLSETRFRRPLAGEGQALVVAGRAECPTDSATIECVDTIHQISNESRQPAVSLHLYSPPLTSLGAYDVALGTRWDVAVADSPDVQVGGDPGLIA